MTDQLLSSDILENQFGPTSLRILAHQDFERIICTVDSKGRNLELSHVTFQPAIEEKFSSIYKQIRDGLSMGKAFRQNSVPFTRQDQNVSQVALTPKLEDWFAAKGKATAVRTKIYAGKPKQHIADIFELYSPLVKWP